jgi:hypothetical protein
MMTETGELEYGIDRIDQAISEASASHNSPRGYLYRRQQYLRVAEFPNAVHGGLAAPDRPSDCYLIGRGAQR